MRPGHWAVGVWRFAFHKNFVFHVFWKGVTGLRTDLRTYGPTDGPTDRPSYRCEDASKNGLPTDGPTEIILILPSSCNVFPPKVVLLFVVLFPLVIVLLPLVILLPVVALSFLIKSGRKFCSWSAPGRGAGEDIKAEGAMTAVFWMEAVHEPGICSWQFLVSLMRTLSCSSMQNLSAIGTIAGSDIELSTIQT